MVCGFGEPLCGCITAAKTSRTRCNTKKEGTVGFKTSLTRCNTKKEWNVGSFGAEMPQVFDGHQPQTLPCPLTRCYHQERDRGPWATCENATAVRRSSKPQLTE